MQFWKYYTRLWWVLFILPLLVFFYLVDFQKDIVLDVLIFVIIQFIIWTFLKYFFFKERPKKVHYYNFWTKIDASSFPSMHSAMTFLLFLFSLYYLNYTYSVLFFLFWLSISYSRIVLKKHFYIDIFSGMVLSSVIFFVFLAVNLWLFYL